MRADIPDLLSAGTLDGIGSVAALRRSGTCLDLDIEPDDIEVSDSVTVVWEIG